MAILPDKIIADYEFDQFVDRVNSNAEKIISDPKFKLTTPNIPGFSFLLKLQVRVFEKSLASAFAPIFIGKKVLNEGLGAIKDAVSSIRTLFSNPIQFLLDEGINNTLGEFPFPLRIEVGSGSPGGLNLPLSDSRDYTGMSIYNYTPVFGSSELPKSGEYTTPADGIPDIRDITIKRTTNNQEQNDLLFNIESGDTIQISDGNFLGVFDVSSVERISDNDSVRLNLSLVSVTDLNNENDDSLVNIPGFDRPSVGFENCQLVLRNFYDPSGSLKIPLSSLGVNAPFLSSLSFVLGDFSKLKSTSPTRKFVERLSERTGLEFDEVFTGILSGNFPKIDFKKIEDDNLEGIDESEDKERETLVTVARFLEIGATNPCFLIGIIVNYVKLLLLPLKVVLGVLKGLGDLIKGPVSLIRTVIKGLSDPLGLICDLISKAFLEVLRPYIQNPILSVGVTWEDALNEPGDPSRGLQPLVSDMVCGDFSKKLKDYIPNQSFLQNLSNQLESDETSGEGPKIPYDLKVNSEIPGNGQVSVNSPDVNDISVFRVSTISNTVEDAAPLLVLLSPGDEFTFSFEDKFAKYRISSKRLVQDSESPYFVINVSKVESILDEAISRNDTDKILSGINLDSLKAQLGIENPNIEFLFIIEKYLPVKLIAVWEAIKGMIALFSGLAMEVPSLLPAIIRSLFGQNEGVSIEERIAKIANGSESPDLEISAIEDLNALLVTNRGNSLSYKGSRTGNSSNSYNAEDRKFWYELVYDYVDGEFGQSPIESYYFNLQENLKSLGLPHAAYRNSLPTQNLGAGLQYLSYYNRNAGGSWKFGDSMPTKGDFYYGAYSAKDIGKSVKALYAVLYRIRDWRPSDNANLEGYNLEIPIIDDNGNKTTLYSGSIRGALNKYKVTNRGFPQGQRVSDTRIQIRRELWFINTYLVPSLNA